MYYRYSVLSETGNEITGREEGTYSELKKRLTGKSYYILSLEPDIFKSIKSVFAKKTIKAGTLSVFFEDMVSMLKTGIAIKEVVEELKESSNEPVMTKALSGVEEYLINGYSLSSAFKETRVFPRLVLNTLKVGEKSGNLEQVFEDLAKHYSREALFLRGLKSAVIYPAVVLSMLAGTMFYVSFNVIPHLEALLPLKGSACFSTRLLLSLSHFLKDFWFVCLLIPVFIIAVCLRFKRSSNERITSFYYKLPFIGDAAKDAAFSAIFSNLAVLLRNGISPTEAFGLIAEDIPNEFLAKKILKLKDFIASGVSFWEALSKDTFFPSFLYKHVRKGEQIGSLDAYLQNLSRYYFDRATRRIHIILGFIQPALLIFCALVLLFIVSAFIMPVYGNLSNIAGGNVNY